MEGGIFCTFGYFGSFKTLGNVAMMHESLKNGNIVFSNIKINKNYFKNYNNYFYFDDINALHDVLVLAGLYAKRIADYNENQMILGLPVYPRGQRPKIQVYFDEMGIFASSSEYKKFHQEIGEDLTQYLLQIRKLGVDLFLIVQRPMKLVKELRDYVAYWIQPEPIFETPLLWFLRKKCIKYSFCVLDDEGNQAYDKKILYDSDGNYYTIETPLKWKFKSIWWTPYYFNMYDDLYLNFKREPVPKTTFLMDSGFFKYLFYNKINNNKLLFNKHIYAKYFENIVDSEVYTFEPKRPNFFSNPNLYIYKLLGNFKDFMNTDVLDFFKKAKKEKSD